MGKKKIYEQWWFWMILGLTIIIIVSIIVGGNITNSCVEDRKIAEDLCEITNGYVDVVNEYQILFEGIYPIQI